jgi:hypothetical protein
MIKITTCPPRGILKRAAQGFSALTALSAATLLFAGAASAQDAPAPGSELRIPGAASSQDAPAEDAPEPGSDLRIPEAAPGPAARTRPPEIPGPGRQPRPAEEEAIPGAMDPTVIQRVRVEDLLLSAIVVAANPDNNIAMIEHEGIGYMVHKGTRIGSSNGVVREITSDTVVIEEEGAGPGSHVVELTLPR